METTAQLIAAFDNQKTRSHSQRIRSSHQGALSAHDLKRKLMLIGVAVVATVLGSLFLVF